MAQKNEQYGTAVSSRSCHRKILVLSGLSGSGKTTMGERLKSEGIPVDRSASSSSNNNNNNPLLFLNKKWIHFDGDSWMSGNDPVDQSGQVNVTNHDKKEIQLAFRKAQLEGYNPLFVHEKPNYEAFEEFYDLMCQDVVKVFYNNGNDNSQQQQQREARKNNEHENGDFNIVMTHSIYCSRTRSYVKQRLEDLLLIEKQRRMASCAGEDDVNTTAIDIDVAVQLVVIHCSDASLVDRRTNRAKQQAYNQGSSSFEDYLKVAMDNGFDISEPTETAFRTYVATWNNGFDQATSEETVLDVMDTNIGLDEMYEKFCTHITSSS